MNITNIPEGMVCVQGTMFDVEEYLRFGSQNGIYFVAGFMTALVISLIIYLWLSNRT